MAGHVSDTHTHTLAQALESPLHRPRPCPGCGHESRALRTADGRVDVETGRCLACRVPDDVLARRAPTPRPPCAGCGQPLLLARPGRTHCARCVRPDYGGATR